MFGLISPIWDFIDDHIFFPLFGRPRVERKRQKKEQELKSIIDPLKAEIGNIVNAKLTQLSARACPICRSTGVKLKRTYASYESVSHTETHSYNEDDEYIDKSGERWPMTRRVDSESEHYDYSNFGYGLKIVCQKCGYAHFSDRIYYKDQTHDDEKERRLETYKQEEMISIDSFLADICPPAETYEKNLEAYNQLLDQLRKSWK